MRNGKIYRAGILAVFIVIPIQPALAENIFEGPVQEFYRPDGYIQGAAVDDFNNDGLSDLVVTYSNTNSYEVFLSNGDGTITSLGICATSPVGWNILCGDINEDGDEDLIFIDDPHLLLGNGDGTFIDPVSYPPYPSNTVIQYVESGDFNEDSYPDIAGAGEASLDQYAVAVFINQQDGTFVPSDSGYYEIGGSVQYGMEARDFDLDGHLDLSISGIGEIMPGYGNGYFSNDPEELLSGTFGGSTRPIDLDNDDDLDLIRAWIPSHYIWLYLNTTVQQGCSEGIVPCPGLQISAYPNPFSTNVNIEIFGYSDVVGELQVFDLSGRSVAVIESVCAEGGAVFRWDGESSSGDELHCGIYTARLSSGNSVITEMLLKL